MSYMLAHTKRESSGKWKRGKVSKVIRRERERDGEEMVEERKTEGKW